MTPWVMLVTAMMSTSADTTFAVPAGSRLVLHNFMGDVSVRPWARAAVRVQAEGERPFQLDVNRDGTSFELRATMRRPVPSKVDYEIHAPAGMGLELAGVHGDISVEGWKSDVVAKTVEGDVTLTGGHGLVSLESVTGGVKVSGAEGRIELSSVQDDVVADDVAGEITAESVNGGVMLSRIHSKLVQAESVNGDVQFDGPVDEAGRYKFSTHSGDLDVALPPQVGATVSVSTFNGGFESTFPVRVNDGGPGKNFRFTLGSGKALVDLESFMGTINLHRADEHAHEHSKDRRKDKEKDADKDKDKDKNDE